MPLTVPPQVRLVYADVSSPGSGGGNIGFDGFYDHAQSAIAGGDVAAALAELGLSYSAGVFTALVPVVLDVLVDLTVAASPGGTNEINFSQPGFLTNQTVPIANPNTLGHVFVHLLIAMSPSWGNGSLDNFSISKDGGNTPLDYLAMQIIRLV